MDNESNKCNTVGELIEELLKHDPETPIKCRGDCRNHGFGGRVTAKFSKHYKGTLMIRCQGY